MKIELDHQKSQEISEVLHTLEPSKRDELHLTDALYCPMKPYCRIVLKLQPHYNRRTAGIFLTGLMFDRLVEEAFKSVKVSIVRSFGAGSSYGTPDVVLNGKDKSMTPLEVKHTRLHVRSKEDIPKKWFEQLTLECVYCQSPIGYLVLGEIDTCLFTVWKVELDAFDLSTASSDHNSVMLLLRWSIIHKDHSNLTINRKECKTCFYNYEQGCPRRPKT